MKLVALLAGRSDEADGKAAGVRDAGFPCAAIERVERALEMERAPERREDGVL
jgi:hypothetical protein